MSFTISYDFTVFEIQYENSGHRVEVTLRTGSEAPSGGVTDHGALTGLADDDHPQYHNNARGDARYSPVGHNHAGVYTTPADVVGAIETHDQSVLAHEDIRFAAGDPVVRLYETNQDIGTNFLPPGTPEGSKVILNGQTTAAENGLYTSTASFGVTGRVDIYTGENYGRIFNVQFVVGDKSDAGINSAYLALPAPEADSVHVQYVIGTNDGSTFTLRPNTISYQVIAELTGRAFSPAAQDNSYSSDVTLTLNDQIVDIDTSGGNVTVTLGPHATIPRFLFLWHRTGSNTLTVVNYTGDGDPFSITIPPGEKRLILPTGAAWDQTRLPQKASELPYTPTTSGDWAEGAPDDTGDALDKLAARSTGGGSSYGEPGPVLQPSLPAYTLPGWVFDTRKTQAWSGNRRLDYYPMHVTRPIKVDQLQCYVNTAGAAGSQLLLGLYEADDAWQPSTRLEASGAIAANSTGSKTYAFTERTLPEGKYLVALNINVSVATGPTMLGISLNAPWLAADSYLSVQDIRCPDHAFTMPDPGTDWTSASSTANGFFAAYAFLRVTGYGT